MRRSRFLHRLREESGATSVIVVLVMTVLLGCAALVVDVGALQARRAQLQDAADAAALALAQACFEDAGSSPLGCAAGIRSAASATATRYAEENVNDHQARVDGIPVFTASTVEVALASDQVGYFGRIWGDDSSTIRVSATARWEQPIVTLALAVASCAFPGEGEHAVVQVSLAVPTVVGNALGTGCGLLSSRNLVSNTTGTIGLVAGGWLTSTSPILGVTAGDCAYDPNLLTTVAATVSKVAPTACANAVRGWAPSAGNPQRVLVPVFDSGLTQLVANDVLGAGDIDRYAVIDLTGYSLSGLLGLGTVAGSDPALCTDADGIAGALLQALPAVLRALLGTATGCQALEGTFVGFVDSAEAAQLLTGVQLVE